MAQTEDERWAYNVEDCVRTREVGEVSAKTIQDMGLGEVESFQQSMFWPVLKAMLRGCKVDVRRRQDLDKQIEEQMGIRQGFLNQVASHAINPNSSVQLIKFFYEDLMLPAIKTRAKKGVPGHLTCDDEALGTIAQREPLLKPFIDAISDYRTMRIFRSNYINAALDLDGRLRCSFNICGTKTFRLSSSKNAFGGGCNFQNIPSDKSKSLGKAKARDSFEFQLPNIRQMIIPDEGYTFFDGDLDRADLQVFAWEIEDQLLKEALKKGVDLHLLHVYILDKKEPPDLDELVETHPKYPDHRGPLKHKREFSKVFCHATDYVGGARTVAAATGRTVHEVERAQRIYLGAHPTIEPYWAEIKKQLASRRYVENKFGYRWYVFDRLDTALSEAVAWIPQSTVGIVINKIWKNFHDNLPAVDTLLQVHDSLGGQIPTHLVSALTPQLQAQARVVVPYADPLVIPFGLSFSDKSWGDCA